MDPLEANDKYRASLRSTFVAGVDTSFAVDAIPTNVPTQITLNWNTADEAIYRVEGVAGDNSSNYTLTGATYVRGSEENIPSESSVNCLNNEEYFNQWAALIAAAQADATAAGNTILTINTTASSATPTPIITTERNLFTITALAAAAEIQEPTGTPTNGMTLIIRIKDNGTARALTYNAIYRAIGVTLPTTTVISKTHYLGMIYNTADSKWDVVAVQSQA